MNNAASFILTSYSFIYEQPLSLLLEVGHHLKSGSPIPSFEENVLLQLCSEAKEIFEKEDNVLDIEGDFIIVGDIHGSFHDLLRILNFYFENKKSKIIFLGDYVDRGSFSLECITLLFAIKILDKDNFFMIRGNHEFDTLCSQYGFKDEIISAFSPRSKSMSNSELKYRTNFKTNSNYFKYTEKVYDSFISAFGYLPICAVLNKTTFCIHGGLCPRLTTIESIQKVKRPINSFDEDKMVTNALWSDPSNAQSHMYTENQRGLGYLFNVDVVYSFLRENKMNRIVRAHQCVTNGCHEQFHSLLITVFSASSYSRDMGNYSGILKLSKENDQIEFVKFFPLHQLKKSEAVFYKVMTSCNVEKEEQTPKCFSFPHPMNSTIVSQAKNLNRFQMFGNFSDSGFIKPVRLSRPNLYANRRQTKPIVKVNSMCGKLTKPLEGGNALKSLNLNVSINKYPVIDLNQISDENNSLDD